MTALNRRSLSFAGVSLLCLCALGASPAKPQGQQSQPQQNQAQQSTEQTPEQAKQAEQRRAYADEVRKSYNFRFGAGVISIPGNAAIEGNDFVEAG
jgi:hypothetical protein